MKKAHIIFLNCIIQYKKFSYSLQKMFFNHSKMQQ